MQVPLPYLRYANEDQCKPSKARLLVDTATLTQEDDPRKAWPQSESFTAAFPHRPVPKLCQNPICLGHGELLFERKQFPQVVDKRHFRVELLEYLEPEIILRNQQVAGSIPAGGSRFFNHFHAVRINAHSIVRIFCAHLTHFTLLSLGAAVASFSRAAVISSRSTMP